MADTKFIIYIREDSGRVVTLDEITSRGLQFQPGEVLTVGDGVGFDVPEGFAARHVEVGNCAYCDKDGNLVKVVEKIEDARPVDTVTKPEVATSLVSAINSQVATVESEVANTQASVEPVTKK